MDGEHKEDEPKVQADDQSIAIDRIRVGGRVEDIHIAHTIGYSSEQISALITQISATFQPRPFDGRCPNKGLDVFDEEDAELFFGRKISGNISIEKTRQSNKQ